MDKTHIKYDCLEMWTGHGEGQPSSVSALTMNALDIEPAEVFLRTYYGWVALFEGAAHTVVREECSTASGSPSRCNSISEACQDIF